MQGLLFADSDCFYFNFNTFRQTRNLYAGTRRSVFSKLFTVNAVNNAKIFHISQKNSGFYHIVKSQPCLRQYAFHIFQDSDRLRFNTFIYYFACFRNQSYLT